MKNTTTFDLKSTSLNELTAIIQRNGFPAFRAKQIFDWVFKKGVRNFEEMTNISEDVRQFLKNTSILNNCSVESIRQSSDGTRKLLLRLQDENFIESVLMPDKGKYTLCVSSQVGCQLNCSFCLTGRIGFKRNLTSAELVDQVLIGKHNIGKDELLTNLVFMGMGEPLLNSDNLIRALELIVSPQAIGISTRRITVSTVGIPEGIRTLGESHLGVNIAISLNAAVNSVRTKIMPINKKYPIESVIKACREYPLTKQRRITFEYVLIKGFNDSIEDAKRLAKLLHEIPCKINVIPLNENPLLPFEAPTQNTIETFCDYLRNKYYTVSVRYSKGQDIEAACGQLAGKKY